MPVGCTPKTSHTGFKHLMKKAQAPAFIQREFLCFYFGRALPNVKLRGFIQRWVLNRRVSERLGSLVFIQKHFFPKNSAAIQGELQFTGFHLQVLWCVWEWVQDRFAEMPSVTWRAVLVNEAVERDEVLGVKG